MTANAGRADLSNMLKISSVPADEPVFLLRGQDACAADAVRHWAVLQEAAGAPPAVIEQALRQADAMAAWPVKKVPGDDHLEEAARKQLAYELGRREWKNGAGTTVSLAAEIARLRAMALMFYAFDQLGHFDSGRNLFAAFGLKASDFAAAGIDGAQLLTLQAFEAAR